MFLFRYRTAECVPVMIMTKNSMEYKIPFVGDPSVGKTSIIQRYSQNKFNDDIAPTVGASNFHFDVTYNEKNVVMNIWDTAGQERFRSLIPLYTRGAALVVMVFDINDPTTYANIDVWYSKLRHEFLLKCPIVLVANKMDLEQLVQISDIKTWAQKNEVPLFFTSALTDQGINDLFQSIAEIVSRPQEPQEVEAPKPISLTEASEQDNHQKKSCC